MFEPGGSPVTEQPSKTRIYADLMQEVKDRLDTIGHLLGQFSKVEPRFAFAQAELCFLQLRYICELVALSACVAHEPTNLSQTILKSWNAERTFLLLDKFNEHCFPKSVRPTRTDGSLHFESVPDTLDAKQLREIYSHCGDMLHRGPLKHLLSGKGRTYDLDKARSWALLIKRSLADHTILMPEQGTLLIVCLASGAKQLVQVVEAQSVDGGAFTVTIQSVEDVAAGSPQGSADDEVAQG